MAETNVVANLQLLNQVFDGEVHTDNLIRKLYATDASVYQEIPAAVAVPKTDSDIQTLIRFARENRIGLIPRAAGTSLAGQVVGAGVVVDVSKHFTSILEINPQEAWVRVQPGVVRDELNMELAGHGMMFGPETSTSNRAMMGGMLGNNSCGSNSIVYGSTRDHVLEVRGLLSDGSAAIFCSVDEQTFSEKCTGPSDSLESTIYRGVRDLLSEPDTRAEIRREFPKPEIHRRNTGYAIDALIESGPFQDGPDEHRIPFDFCKLIAGSEGTLLFLTEMKLRCVPLPPVERALLCAHFSSIDQALRATQLAMLHQPYACELIDRLTLEGAARNIEQRRNAGFIVDNPEAVLLIEVRGESKTDVQLQTELMQQDLRKAELGYAFPVLFGNEANPVWELRKAGVGIVSSLPGDAKPVSLIEDTAVSLNDLPAYIAEVNQLLREKYGMHCVHYGHAGAGEIHLRPVLNLKTTAGNQQFQEIASEIASLVKKYRGSLSGEHGDGRLRSAFLSQMIGPRNFEVLRKIKQLWDPENIFNPNKIIDALPMNRQLRYEPGQPTTEMETIFDFDAEKGVVRAAELCNGSGDCRKSHLSGGTMCPSYMATRNEIDTTRARANLLRQVLTNPTDQAFPFNNHELRKVMELCLSCKGCKRECPSNVDVAKLKAEFLQGYYDANGVPRRVKMIANFARHMALASNVPWLFNGLVANSMTGTLMKRMAGISRKRSIPKLSATTLRQWFAGHKPHPNAGRTGRVVLFCDEFTNFIDAPIGIATVELLEKIGYAVDLPVHAESGRAAISQGLLRVAREYADANVRTLEPLVSDKVPLIGIEPSALLSFRDEYPVLVSESLREPARRLAKNCLLIDEFVSQLIVAGKLDAKFFTEENRRIRLHGHCHQRALASLAPTVQMLQLPRNYSVKLIPSGCCGMAGSFGYDVEHFEVSMQIGELVLFPAVRSEPEDVLIAAPGTSCRHQIADGTGRWAQHPVEILRAALR